MLHSHPLRLLRHEAEKELGDILSYWKQHTVDVTNGGFTGRIKYGNVPVPDADKGSVLNARILWTFAAAFRLTGDKSCLDLAERAYEYLANHFLDKVHGGVLWTVTAEGRPHETKKQVYASAFALYGLAEYYRASGNKDVMRLAINLFNTLIDRAYDIHYGGFFEAYTHDWHELTEQRLSAKDANEKKSANTNLHIVEAFANLGSRKQ